MYRALIVALLCLQRLRLRDAQLAGAAGLAAVAARGGDLAIALTLAATAQIDSAVGPVLFAIFVLGC